MNHRNLLSLECVRDDGEFAGEPLARVFQRPVMRRRTPVTAWQPTPDDVALLRTSITRALGACGRITDLLAALKQDLAEIG